MTVFCVHDADAAGTMIWHTLQNETKARASRKIEVVNLGLEPWEGVEMGLEIEPVEAIDNRRAVAPYVAAHDDAWRRWLAGRGCWQWAQWLQKFRIELNAMRPARRIEWLTEKIEAHPPRKVVPPPAVLHAGRVVAARMQISEELEKRARIAERTEEILAKIEWPVPMRRLPKITERYLERRRSRSWGSPMHSAGVKIARRALEKIK